VAPLLLDTRVAGGASDACARAARAQTTPHAFIPHVSVSVTVCSNLSSVQTLSPLRCPCGRIIMCVSIMGQCVCKYIEKG